MKKVYVIYGDYCHPLETAIKSLENIFDNDEIIFTSTGNEIPWDNMENEVKLYISFKSDNTTLNPKTGVDYFITPERERALYNYVANGGKALFVHAGLVGYPLDSLYHKVTGGVFLIHPPEKNITYIPVNKEHPILDGVNAFTVYDEKYTCQIDNDVEVLMVGADDEYAGTISAWCKNLGKGKSVSFAPGHSLLAANDENYLKFIKNAVNWLINR